MVKIIKIWKIKFIFSDDILYKLSYLSMGAFQVLTFYFLYQCLEVQENRLKYWYFMFFVLGELFIFIFDKWLDEKKVFEVKYK